MAWPTSADYRVTSSGGEYFADSTSRKVKLVVR